MMDDEMTLPLPWREATPCDDEVAAAYRLEPPLARAWIEDGQEEPVMLEADGSDQCYTEPPPKVSGWLKTRAAMLVLEVRGG